MSSWKEDSPSWRKGSALSPDDSRENGTATPSTFQTITQRLDPRYSYVIFEKTSGEGRESDFQQVLEIVERLNLSIRARDFLRDEERGGVLLVVCLDSGRADEILQELMRGGWPKDVFPYVYGRHVEQ
jgi:hypothetical protein